MVKEKEVINKGKKVKGRSDKQRKASKASYRHIILIYIGIINSGSRTQHVEG